MESPPPPWAPARALALLLLLSSLSGAAEGVINFLLITESAQQELNERFKEGFKSVEEDTGETFDFTAVNFTRRTSDDHYEEMCLGLGSGDFSAVVDMAWGGWIKGRKTAAALGLPYVRVEAANHLFVQAADDFLKSQNATDAALIFEDQVWVKDVPKNI